MRSGFLQKCKACRSFTVMELRVDGDANGARSRSSRHGRHGYLLNNSGENRRAQSSRPRRMRHANLLCVPKGGACPPFLNRFRHGVTLTEIMLAFLILCIATISASSVMSYGHRGTTKDFRRVEAMEILTDRLNRFCAMSFASAAVYLNNAGADTYTFNDPIEGIALGTIEMPASKNRFQVSATLKRQIITFPTMMKLTLPNPGYVASDVRTWQLQDDPTGEIRFDGMTGVGHNPYKVLKVLVHVQPIGVNQPELAVEAISFIVDLDV